MSNRAKSKPTDAKAQEPVDVVDGIPDRSSSPAFWKYLAIVAVMVAWIGVLFCVKIFGELQP